MAFVLRRLVRAVPAVVAILVITFLMIHLAPGDAVDALAGGGVDEATYEYLRSYLGLDQPLWKQFLSYVSNVVQGDLGRSFAQGGTPVTELIAERLPATFLLMATALVLSSVGGTLIGALVAKRPFGAFDFGVNTTSLVWFAIPNFWVAQLALLVFAFGAGWFPVQGMTDPRVDSSGLAQALDVAHHLVLPALVLATSELALVIRVTRAGMFREMGKDYVQVARGKGASERRTIFRHALPNALLPVVTVIGTRMAFLFTGAIVIETVFGWPGLGTLLLTAAESRDRPVLLGLVLLISVSVIAANLVVDLIYGWIDPRIRYD
jgi:peptide/nickel transport system permease protein